ncbi:outer membrane protein transport protein [Enterovibrio nigricans]|uniref:Long-chain fatty acid transport protein n=1 Tax=Enterovibrio nigricans DSM 22720 TaxID=1121868 RepID=A0A1T4UCA1_9GAMM|nr:outer membrane protein transport protein [Enterovibrio nigricans]SKA50375.1 long-chain fatty acid transport protein [Enterovibrio nigricans DSM 22720]
MSHKYLKTAIAITVACTSSLAWSAGYQVSEHSASGLGRAFAGEAAVADNASVLARNPAAGTLFKRATTSGVISFVDPNVDVSHTGPSREQSVKDVAPYAIVPASYYISPINEQFSWGVALFTGYGVATGYPDDFNQGRSAGDTSLVSVTFNPSIAWQANEHWSLGVGLSAVYGIAELNRHKGLLALAIGGNASDKLITMEGDTFGFGWNIGALYALDPNNRFGFAYRSEVTLDFDGDFTDHTGIAAGLPPGTTLTGKLEAVLPATFEFSGFHQVAPAWAVHYSVLWTEWSQFKELRATNTRCNSSDGAGVCFLKEEHYENALRWSVGVTHNLNDDWTVRAGFAFDEQAGKATLSIPDTDRYWYSIGATYQYSSDLSFDAGFTLIDSKSGTFTEDGEIFDSSGNALIYAMQANYTF